MNIPVYPCGKYVECPHCIWLVQGHKIKNTKWKGMKPSLIFSPSKKFLGVTIFDNHTFIKDSFNVVNGTRYGDLNYIHDYRNLSSLLKGTTMFVNYLNLYFNIDNIKVLVNSDYKGFKELLHSLVTPITNVESLFKDNVKPTLLPTLKPYETDIIFKLEEKDCLKLLESGDAFTFIEDYLSSSIKYHYDVNIKSFYLFLDYKYIKNKCIVTGLISIPKF
jgi:hypothetical protein